MLPGPLFYFDLLISARRARTYWIRGIYGALLLLILWGEFPSAASHGAGGLSLHELALRAQMFFIMFSVAQLLLVLAVGPALVAPIISTERERRTIEYLFATDLSNAEIVLGKLLSRLLHLTGFVAAGLPILALASLLGGVDHGELMMVFVVTGCTMAAVTSLALMVSVRAARVRDALAQIYLLLFAFIALPPIATGFLGLAPRLWPLYKLAMGCVEANPLWALTHILGTRAFFFGGSSGWNTAGLLARDQLLFAAAMIAIACGSVRRVHLRQSGKGAGKRQVAFATRGKPVGMRPILWKEIRANRFGGQSIASRIALGLFAAGFLVGVGVLFWMSYGMTNRPPAYRVGYQPSFYEYARFGLILLTFAALLLIASRAGSCITTERERDAWTTLLSTPLSAREILWGKFLGNIYAARFAVWLWLAVMALAIFGEPAAAVAVPFVVVTTLILAAFVSVLGTFFSLKFRTTLRSQAMTFGAAVFVGGGYLFCSPLMVFMVGLRHSEIGFALCMPMLIALAYDPVRAFNVYSTDQWVAYFLGNMAYLAATVALFEAAVHQFDRANGRIVEGGSNARGVEAELVEVEVVDSSTAGATPRDAGDSAAPANEPGA